MNTKQYVAAVMLLLGGAAAQAQVVYAAEESFDKQKWSGLQVKIPVAARDVEKKWESQLGQWGTVSRSRGTYRITSANVPGQSSPVYAISAVSGGRKESTIFLAVDKGGGQYLRPGDPGYRDVEQTLIEFVKRVQHENEVSAAEEGFSEAQRDHQKLVRTGERLQRDVESNKREKERLERRLIENAQELEKLLKDIETNKTEQANALNALEGKKQNVEAVKAKPN